MRKKLLLLGGMLFLFINSILAQGQVTGKVIDASTKTPIQGASVLIKGTRTGTTTSADGSFSLTLPANSKVLVITSVGYSDQEITVRGNTVQVDLIAGEGKSLNEVIVTGYGTKIKKFVAF